MKNKYKYFIFDMDGTVCESRQLISKDMERKLLKLATNNKDVFIISGASEEQMEKQIPSFYFQFLSQSGNFTPLWKNYLSHKEEGEIMTHIVSLMPIKRGMIENRGCQISLSLTGHNAPIEKKKNFDKDQQIRKNLLKAHPFKSQTLTCRIAGTTCIDYTSKNGTKGKNIKRLIKEMGWNKNECIYFGDALYKGGNDETVIGVIKTVKVSGPQDLLKKLDKYI